MGILSKLFGGGKTAAVETEEAPPCPHTVLLPRWDSIDDIGHEERATHFVCESCNQTFTPDEARKLHPVEEITFQRPQSQS